MVIRLLLLLGILRQLLLPNVVCGILIDIGKQDIGHFRIPAHGVAFNSFFDVLNISVR